MHCLSPARNERFCKTDQLTVYYRFTGRALAASACWTRHWARLSRQLAGHMRTLRAAHQQVKLPLPLARREPSVTSLYRPTVLRACRICVIPVPRPTTWFASSTCARCVRCPRCRSDRAPHTFISSRGACRAAWPLSPARGSYSFGTSTSRRPWVICSRYVRDSGLEISRCAWIV